MKKLFSLLFACAMLSCTKAPQEASGKEGHSLPEEIASQGQDSIAKGIYQQATVYTGSTDYLFEDENGEPLMIRLGYEDSTVISFPNQLLEDPDTLEGVQGPNPQLLGKTFLLIYRDGVLAEIKLEE